MSSFTVEFLTLKAKINPKVESFVNDNQPLDWNTFFEGIVDIVNEDIKSLDLDCTKQDLAFKESLVFKAKVVQNIFNYSRFQYMYDLGNKIDTFKAADQILSELYKTVFVAIPMHVNVNTLLEFIWNYANNSKNNAFRYFMNMDDIADGCATEIYIHKRCPSAEFLKSLIAEDAVIRFDLEKERLNLDPYTLKDTSLFALTNDMRSAVNNFEFERQAHSSEPKSNTKKYIALSIGAIAVVSLGYYFLKKE